MIAGTMFLRWKIRSLVFRLKSNMSTAYNGMVACGVADDTDNTSAAISTSTQIIALRTSRLERPYVDITMKWSPVDKSKWYYINPESSSSDLRFTTPGTFLAVTDQIITNPVILGGTPPGSYTGIVYTIDMHYVLEFRGATVLAV